MARNGAGTYARVAGPYVYNTIIDQVAVNLELDDITTALTNSLTKNGETTATANQPMGTFRHTGVGNGVARTDYPSMGQLEDGTVNWVAGGGTADAITATYAPALTALVDGQLCFVRATAANATTTPTFAPNGLTARTITLNGGQALVAGNIFGVGHELILRYLLASTRWELLNPNVISITGNAATATTATNQSGGTVAATTGSFSGAVTGAAAITSSSPSAGIGYATGAGGTVAQLTAKTTEVTLNKINGKVTMNAAALAANTTVFFTFTNSTLMAGDVLNFSIDTASSNIGAYLLQGGSSTNGSAIVSLRNLTAGSLSDAVTFTYTITRCVTA